MANVLTKIGNQDNVATYEHVCDTKADLNNIPARQISLGSTAIVLEGESGNVEVYMAKSDKTWKLLASIASAEGGEEEEEEEPLADNAQADDAVLNG